MNNSLFIFTVLFNLYLFAMSVFCFAALLQGKGINRLIITPKLLFFFLIVDKAFVAKGKATMWNKINLLLMGSTFLLLAVVIYVLVIL